MRQPGTATPAVEWPTLILLLATYGLWAVGTTAAFTFSPLLGIVLTGIAIGQFSSLQHEILHGHPFRSKALNEALAFPALTLTVPYGRLPRHPPCPPPRPDPDRPL